MRIGQSAFELARVDESGEMEVSIDGEACSALRGIGCEVTKFRRESKAVSLPYGVVDLREGIPGIFPRGIDVESAHFKVIASVDEGEKLTFVIDDDS